jgi:DNA topoisomerase-1
MHTISLEEALELFRLPRKLGESNGEEVSDGIRRFGPFAKRGSVYATLKKEDDPYTIDLARAVFLVEEKEEIARNRIIKEFPDSDIQVLNGRYGPYISDGKLNGRIPKDREPASLTLEEVVQLMEETGKPMRGRFGRKAAAKAPAKKATAKKAASAAGGKKPAAKKATAKKAASKKSATNKAASKPASARRTPAKRAVPVAPPEPPPLLTPKPFTGGKRVVKKAG